MNPRSLLGAIGPWPWLFHLQLPAGYHNNPLWEREDAELMAARLLAERVLREVGDGD